MGLLCLTPKEPAMVMELPTDLTPELVPLYWLIGTWEGTGKLGAGEDGDLEFKQTVKFIDSGLPFLEYHSQSWLIHEDGQILRPLSTEMGFWSLDRALEEGDVGPGMTPADVVPVFRRQAHEEEEVEEQILLLREIRDSLAAGNKTG